MEFQVGGVNEAFQTIVTTMAEGKIPIDTVSSRAGEVLKVTDPITVIYECPHQRVLFNRARDANPFFHLFEALWMLAGREDVAPLLQFNSKIGDVASDDGKIFNGAYGNRWRNWKVPPLVGDTIWRNVDQLNLIAQNLRDNPNSRREVMEMWSVHSDLLRNKETKDVCCNTHAYFSVDSNTFCDPLYLNMTVMNRSNDLVWGMLGANVVHFSMLLEYMAAKIGVSVGRYVHFTNNLHAYLDNWEPSKWLSEYGDRTMHSELNIHYNDLEVLPLVEDVEVFDQEVVQFIDEPLGPKWNEPFLIMAAEMVRAFFHHKDRDYRLSLEAVDRMAGQDWQIACREWITRRKKAYEKGTQT